MSKKVSGYIKLQVAAGKATPSPPIGPALGQKGVNIMAFCKDFNAQTQNMEQGMPIPVVITVYADKSFTFVMKTPPVTYFLKKAAGIQSGSKATGRVDKVGSVTMAQVRDIARVKMKDLSSYDEDGACAQIVGSARSMGLEVLG